MDGQAEHLCIISISYLKCHKGQVKSIGLLVFDFFYKRQSNLDTAIVDRPGPCTVDMQYLNIYTSIHGICQIHRRKTYM